jgi:AcrR family transcriptional regulator
MSKPISSILHATLRKKPGSGGMPSGHDPKATPWRMVAPMLAVILPLHFDLYIDLFDYIRVYLSIERKMSSHHPAQPLVLEHTIRYDSIRGRLGTGVLAGTGGKSAKPKPSHRGTLTRGIVMKAAVDLASSRSFEDVSIRQIAEELGVTPMAIYNHVSGKAEIERHILAHLFRSRVAKLEMSPVDDGASVLRKVCTGLFKVMLDHPDIFLVFTHNATMDEVIQFQEQLYEGFRRCGLPPDSQRAWGRIFGGFIHGSAALVRASHDAAWEEYEAAYPRLDPERYPNVVRSRSATAGVAPSFANELDRLIDMLVRACMADDPSRPEQHESE